MADMLIHRDFKSIKEKFEERSTINSLFSARRVRNDRGLEASYDISLLIAKCGKTLTIGENLIKPAIPTFIKVVLEKDDRDLQSMPLSNNNVSSRIDEMSCDVEVQLDEKLKYTHLDMLIMQNLLRICYFAKH